MNLYQSLLMDHYHNPRNYGPLTGANFACSEFNPSCGDIISLEGIIKGNTLLKLHFTAQGCVISQAAASLLTELCAGKSITEILSFNEQIMQKLIGMNLGPLRLKCALLSLNAVQHGLKKYLKSS